MKKVILLFCLAILVTSCDAPKKTPEQIQSEKKADDEYKAACKAENEALEPLREKITKYLMSKEEPSIKDVMWLGGYNIKVARYYKGSNQDGFAQYLCSKVSELGWNNENHKLYIDIIDILKVIHEKEYVIIGEATCDFKMINQPPTIVDFTKK